MHRTIPLLLTTLVLAGCLGASPPEPAPDWERFLTVPPKGFAEVNLHLNATANLTYAWSTNGTTLGFDVHDHQGGEVTVHEAYEAEEGEGRFHASEAGTYSLLWRGLEGQETMADVHVELGGSFTVQSVHEAGS